MSCLDLADVAGRRGGHIIYGIALALTATVVVTDYATYYVLILAARENTVTNTVNGAVRKGVTGYVTGVRGICADISDKSAELVSALKLPLYPSSARAPD